MFTTDTQLNGLHTSQLRFYLNYIKYNIWTHLYMKPDPLYIPAQMKAGEVLTDAKQTNKQTDVIINLT